MDGAQNQNPYGTNGIGTSAPPYPSASAISPQQLQQGLPTLPPLHSQNAAMQNIYGSHPSTPRTGSNPHTPQPQNMSNYPPPGQANRGSWMPNPYPQQQQGYATTQPMMPQTSMAPSHPQPIAPAPASGARPPVLRPMPAGGVMPQSGLPSPYGGSPMMPHQQSMMQEADQPTHVVGSQGRRGILPSAPGRPAAPTGAGASKNTVIPQKDADGKFPCPHCTKTYLHAKHLKRHLLRHTGDRPYMCVLCRDTFSRSDILKRHFQKCSIRRGNPTGASHLSHPQAHVKKNQQQAVKAEGDLSHMNGMNGMPTDGLAHGFGMVQMPDNMANMGNDQNQLSRSSSVGQDAANRDRRAMPGPYNGDANINPQLANFSMPPNQNGLPMYGASGATQPSGMVNDWTQMFPHQPGAHPTSVHQSYPSPNHGQTPSEPRTVPNLPPESDPELPGAISTDVDDRSLFFCREEMQPQFQNRYDVLADQVLSFLQSPGATSAEQVTGMNDFFSATNIRCFLENYTHFHVHFSFLHIPTFRIMNTYTGLTAALCCIGACYTNSVLSSQIREVVDCLQSSLERDCDLYVNGHPVIQPGFSQLGLEQLQALVLLQIILVWNGTPAQRERGLILFPVLATIAKSSGLTRTNDVQRPFSILHQPKPSLPTVSPEAFDWKAWVHQEARIRVLYMLYISDVANGLYFNLSPEFDAFSLNLPLPSDDAAWEANDAEEAARALSLYGVEATRFQNPDGSQRSKQPELSSALRTLMHESYQMLPGSTNLHGKFILIHAIIAQLCQARTSDQPAIPLDESFQITENDWVATRACGLTESTNTNDMPSKYGPILTALDKFKANWDMDMAIQFPPASYNPRRYGFSRDGIHFYWLANWMLHHNSTPELDVSADARFLRIIHLLKSVKSWVMSDGASRGEELGSVGDIHQQFGAADLTLDMAKLFSPLPAISDDLDKLIKADI